MGFKSVRNPCNTLFKQQVVAAMYHDIFIFPETHCLNDEKLEFDGYVIYQNNRVPHVRASKGSGGIAIAIHIACGQDVRVDFPVGDGEAPRGNLSNT